MSTSSYQDAMPDSEGKQVSFALQRDLDREEEARSFGGASHLDQTALEETLPSVSSFCTPPSWRSKAVPPSCLSIGTWSSSRFESASPLFQFLSSGSSKTNNKTTLARTTLLEYQQHELRIQQLLDLSACKKDRLGRGLDLCSQMNQERQRFVEKIHQDLVPNVGGFSQFHRHRQFIAIAFSDAQLAEQQQALLHGLADEWKQEFDSAQAAWRDATFTLLEDEHDGAILLQLFRQLLGDMQETLTQILAAFQAFSYQQDRARRLFRAYYSHWQLGLEDPADEAFGAFSREYCNDPLPDTSSATTAIARDVTIFRYHSWLHGLLAELEESEATHAARHGNSSTTVGSFAIQPKRLCSEFPPPTA